MSGSTTKARRVASARGRQFLMASGIARGVARANSSPDLAVPPMRPPPPLPPAPNPGKDAYETAAAAAKPSFDTAERLLAAPMLSPQVAATKQAYTTAKAAVTGAVQGGNFVGALQSLPAQTAAAAAVLRAKSQADAALAQKRKIAGQIGTFAAMEGILANVKLSNLPEGMAKNLREFNGDAGKEFKAYLDKMQAVENAKKGVDPKQPVPKPQAEDIKVKCGEMVGAAQAYLAHFEKSYATKQPSKGALSRKQQCEEGIKAATQYSLAMDLDIAKRPTAANPWDAETEMRMAGVQFAFRLEQGNKKLRGLGDDGGAKGASDSYWARNKSVTEVVEEQRTGQEAAGKRTYIFKPTQGEENPLGMTAPKGAGAAKEALASAGAKAFAAQTGIDLGVPETTVVSVGQYALAGGDLAAPSAIGSAQQVAARADTDLHNLPVDTFKKIKPIEVQKIALLDMMSLSMDRHGGNLMVDLADPNDPKLIPIDHGASLPSRNDFPAVKDRFGGLETKNFGNATNPVNVLLAIPSAFEPFDPEILAGLDLLDPAAIHAEMQGQVAAMDQVHPNLGASQKVGPDSLAMSKRSMMFLKKAAKTLSPAEVQIAIGQYGEKLFDATDADFATVADQVIADMTPKREAYKELLSLSGTQRYEMEQFLTNTGGWAESSNATDIVMADPENMLKLFKSKTVNPAARPKITLFNAPKADPDQVFSQADKDAMTTAFPVSDPAKPEHLAAFKEFTDSNFTTDQLTVALTALGGKPPTLPLGALRVMRAWTELQTPAFQAERAQLPFPDDEPCTTAVQALVKGKLTNRIRDQASAQVNAAASQVDPAAARTQFATDTLAEAKRYIDLFFDAARAAPVQAEWQRLTAKLANGPGPNQSAADFAKEIEDDAQALLAAVASAGIADARVVLGTVEAALQGFRWPEGRSDADNNKYKLLADARFTMGGAGNVSEAQKTVRQLLQEQAAIQAIVVPVAAPQPQPQPANAPVQPQQPAATPLPAFDWTQARASAVKKQAVTLRLFKDKDTGMTDALKPVNQAREAAEAMPANAPTATKRKLYTAAEEACGAFNRYVNGKLRGLSEDERWTGFCDSAADAAQSEYEKYKGLREGLG